MTDDQALRSLASHVADLQQTVAEAEREWRHEIDQVGTEHRDSARNLVHYWALRQRDLRALQRQLARYGLSSLGRSEARVEQNIDAVAGVLDDLINGRRYGSVAPSDFSYGQRALRRRADRLFGPARPGRRSRVMVTLPSEAAGDAGLVKEMVVRGMSVARINCAHDDIDAWTAMVANVRDAVRSSGMECRIAMDLAGPKLRTGPIAPGPRVLKLKPIRSATGHVIDQARCVLVPTDGAPVPHPHPHPHYRCVPVPDQLLASLSHGDSINLRDARGAHRRMVVEHVLPNGRIVAATDHTIYLVPGLHLHGPDGLTAEVGALPAVEGYLHISGDQLLRLDADSAPADPAVDQPSRISCTMPELIPRLEVGAPVLFDDGKIAAHVVGVEPQAAVLRISGAADRGSRLRAGRGINVPQTSLPLPALSTADRDRLAFIAEHADIVGLSFVRTAQDVQDLLAALHDLGNTTLGIIVKIETAQAFQQLPAILLTAMRRHAAGVMIARGDLAVECGYEQMAELQEEILWLCEAAHLPVVWATEVLDRLAKSGRPTRAEITDAAMAGRAECVMLNKGPHILEAITTLDSVLTTMAEHSQKKTPLLRPLRSWAAPAD